MGIITHRGEDFKGIGSERGVVHDLVEPNFVLAGRRKLAEDHEVGSFEVVGALGELFDRVAAVHEETTFAIDEGDSGGYGGSVEIAFVEDAEAGGGIVEIEGDIGRIWGGGVGGSAFESFEGGSGDGVVGDGDGDDFAGTVVANGESVFGDSSKSSQWGRKKGRKKEERGLYGLSAAMILVRGVKVREELM